jgi:hypothetical protein
VQDEEGSGPNGTLITSTELEGIDHDQIARLIKKVKTGGLKTLGAGRLGHQIEALPEFDAVFRAVRRELRQAGFTG